VVTSPTGAALRDILNVLGRRFEGLSLQIYPVRVQGATAGREIQLNLWPFFVKQQRLIGSYGRNRADLDATLEWAAAGRLRPVIDRVLPLAEAATAFKALRNRQVLGKLLIRPAAF